VEYTKLGPMHEAEVECRLLVEWQQKVLKSFQWHRRSSPQPPPPWGPVWRAVGPVMSRKCPVSVP
jgi:hypothetical protein